MSTNFKYTQKIKNAYVYTSLLFLVFYFLLPLLMNTKHTIKITNKSKAEITAVIEVFDGDSPGSYIEVISDLGIINPGESKSGSYYLYEISPQTCTSIHILDLSHSLIKKVECNEAEIIFSDDMGQ